MNVGWYSLNECMIPLLAGIIETRPADSCVQIIYIL